MRCENLFKKKRNTTQPVIPFAETQIRGTKQPGSWWCNFETYPWLQHEQWSLWWLASHKPRDSADRSSRGRCHAGRSPYALPQSSTGSGPGTRGSTASCNPQPHPRHGPLPPRDPQRAPQKKVRQRGVARQEAHPVAPHLICMLLLLTLRLPADALGTVTWTPWFMFSFYLLCFAFSKEQLTICLQTDCLNLHNLQWKH